jgi:FkbM family methyltransferase
MFLKEFILKITTHLFLREKILKKRFFSGKIIILDDYISSQIIVHDVYEKQECECIEKYILKKKFKNFFFLDIGSNIGNHSIYFSKYFKKVLSFEPNQMLFNLLKINTQEYKNIKTYNIGLSNCNKNKDLYYCNENLGGGTLIKKNLLNYKKKIFSIKVKLKKLDNIIFGNKLQNIGLIKLDAEGHEQQIIEGMKNVLKKCSPIILIEVNNKFLSSLNLIKTLKNNDYIYYYEMVNRFKMLSKFLSTPLRLKKIVEFKKQNYSLIVCSKTNILT